MRRTTRGENEQQYLYGQMAAPYTGDENENNVTIQSFYYFF